MKEDVYIEETTYRPPPSLSRRVSWGAIFAGLFVTIIIQVILTLLGTAIGASTVDPMEEQNPIQGLALGAAIWLVVSGLISLFAGSYVAGRLSGGPRRMDGLLHGVVTFSVAEVAMILLLTTTVGSLIGGTGSMLSGMLSNRANQGAAQQPGSGAMSAIGDQLKQAFPQAGALVPTGRDQGKPSQLTSLAQQDPELGAAMARLAAQGGNDQQARQQVLNLLTTKHAMQEQQASVLLDQWVQNYQQAGAQVSQEARQAGDKAAKGVSQGALWAFIGMLLGLIVAAWGGWAGTASLPRYREPVTAPA